MGAMAAIAVIKSVTIQLRYLFCVSFLDCVTIGPCWIMPSKRKSPEKKRIVYQEFGQPDNSAALKRGVPDLSPNQQNIRVQASRAGRKGKTVTLVTGFQHTPETLNQLLKQLKTQCGSGGTVKENALEIQGDCREKIIQILTQLGYKAKMSGG